MAVITTKTAKSEIIYAYNNSRLYACCMQFKMVKLSYNGNTMCLTKSETKHFTLWMCVALIADDTS